MPKWANRTVRAANCCKTVDVIVRCSRAGLIGVLLSTSLIWAQDVSVAQARHDGTVRLLISVTTKSGEPVTDLQEQDFTVYEGFVTHPIRYFQSYSAPKSQHGRHSLTNVTLRTSDGTHSPLGSSPLYELTFVGAKPTGQREFHEVGVQVDRSNLEITTSAGYITSAY
jgi:hypothetical protein